ncbi:hypothetical protein BST61_g11198 [Cercospora zeina]
MFRHQHAPDIIRRTRDTGFNMQDPCGASIAGVEGRSASLPVPFSAVEKKHLMSDFEAASLGMRAMSEIKDALGDLFSERGIVRPEQYAMRKGRHGSEPGHLMIEGLLNLCESRTLCVSLDDGPLDQLKTFQNAAVILALLGGIPCHQLGIQAWDIRRA